MRVANITVQFFLYRCKAVVTSFSVIGCLLLTSSRHDAWLLKTLQTSEVFACLP